MEERNDRKERKRSKRAKSKRKASKSKKADALVSLDDVASGLDVRSIKESNDFTDEEHLEETPSTTTEKTEQTAKTAKTSKTDVTFLTAKVNSDSESGSFATSKHSSAFLEEKSSIFTAGGAKGHELQRGGDQVDTPLSPDISWSAPQMATARRGSTTGKASRRNSGKSTSSLSTNQWDQNIDEWSLWDGSAKPESPAKKALDDGFSDSQNHANTVLAPATMSVPFREQRGSFIKHPYVDDSPGKKSELDGFLDEDDDISIMSEDVELQGLSSIMDRVYECQKKQSSNVQHVLLREYIMTTDTNRETAETLASVWMEEQPLAPDGHSPSAMALISKLHEVERGGKPPKPPTRSSSLIHHAPLTGSATPGRRSLPPISETYDSDDEGYNSSQLSIIYAEPPERKMRCNLRRLLILGCLVVIAAVIGIGTFIVLQVTENESEELLEPTQSPSFAPTFISEDILAAAIQYSGEDAFGEQASPQLRAVGWMSSVDTFDTLGLGQEAFIQRYALATLYFSLRGEQWITQEYWIDPTKHECDWSVGITCGNDDLGRRQLVTNELTVNGVDMTRNNLQGSIPSELNLLSSLRTVRASKNSIEGVIPSPLVLPRLQELDLSHNQLTGSIPATLADSGNLVIIDLSYNDINGTLSTELYGLSFLRTLVVANNKLSGALSEEMYRLQKLVALDVRNNTFTGQIPNDLALIPNLDVLRLDYNQFTGTLPLLKGGMTTTTTVTLSHNKIKGGIVIDPTYLFSTGAADFEVRLQHVDVSYNELTGPISPLIGFVYTLRHVDLSGNQLTGKFPSDMAWAEIEFLAAASNQLTGTLPKGLPTLTHFDMSDNYLGGAIPAGFCDYVDLQFLSVMGNHLDGAIPSCIGQLTALRELTVNNNLLFGTIPPALGQLSQLGELDLSTNSLEGTIPNELGKVVTLRHIRLNDNILSGPIPSELGRLTDLKTLHLGGNELTGLFPSELGALKKLDSLYVKGNSVGGEIPVGLCQADLLNLMAKDIGCDIHCACCMDGTGVCGN